MERASDGHRSVDRDGTAAARPPKLQRVCGWRRRAALSAALLIGTGACAHMRPPVMGKYGRPIGMPCMMVNCKRGSPGGIFYKAQMRMADLNLGNFSEADLREADLSASDMYKAKLWDADLRDAQLRSTNLRGADFRGANLTRAVLLKANLRDADFRGANLTEAVLRKAKPARRRPGGSTASRGRSARRKAGRAPILPMPILTARYCRPVSASTRDRGPFPVPVPARPDHRR